MERLLITGVDTLVGSNLALYLARRYQVVGLYGTHRVRLPGVETLPCDLADPCRISLATHSIRPDWIIHCGPLARSSWDVLGKQPPPASESLVSFRLAEAAREIGSRLAVIISDCVVSGRRMFSAEDCSVAAEHGWAKIARDTEIMLAKTEALLVRTHTYGWSPHFDESSFAEKLYHLFTTNRSAKRDPKLRDFRPHATPILATDLADFVMAALHRRTTGLLHLGGAERTSAAEFACQLAAAFGLRCSDVARPRHTPNKDTSRETSLDSTRARRLLSTAMPMLREGLARFVTQAGDFRMQLHGAEVERRLAA